MQAGFSVELGPEDDCLELPWASADGRLRYFDLKQQPELLLNISEADGNRELGEFLLRVNSAISMLETVKCDTWATDELDADDEAFGALWKFGSYVDLIFAEAPRRPSFEAHENFSREVAGLLRLAPEIASAAEFVIRRCYYHTSGDMDRSDAGFCMTFYLLGYGDDEVEARKSWSVGLKLVENALLQKSAMERQAHG